MRCPKCQTRILETALNQPQLAECRGCGSFIQAEIFPAYFQQTAPTSTGELIVIEGEASCFYHPSKKAVLHCHGCGRFICALCDCDLNGEHFCPSCLEVGRTKGKIKNLENKRTRYDSVALSLAVYPLLLFYFTFITAPAALFVALRYWNAPRSIIRPSRFRYVVAITFATFQIAAWVLGIYVLVRSL